MNENDKQQRTFDDILLELMVQNETLDKIQTSALKVVDLLTPISESSKESLKAGTETPVSPDSRESLKADVEAPSTESPRKLAKDENNDFPTLNLLEPLNGILQVAQESLATMKSVEAGIVMLTDYSGLMRNSLSIIANDLSATYNYLVESDRKRASDERKNAGRQLEKDSEMMKLLARLGADKPEAKPAPAVQKEDGFLAKLLGPLAIIGGLLAGFVTGVVGYFTKLFTGILSSLSKILGIGKFLSKIGLNSEFLTKLAAPFKEVFGKIKDFIKPVTDFIGEMFGKISNLFSKGGSLGKVGEFFANMKNTLMKAIEPFITRFKKFFGIGKLFGAIFGRLMVIWDVFKSVEAAVDSYSKTGDIGTALQTGISELLSRVIGMPLDILKSAVSWIAGKLGFKEVEAWLDSFNISAVIKEIIDRVVTAGRNVFASVFQFISNFVEDFSNGMKEGGILGGIMKILQKIGYYLIAKPLDLLVNYLANLAESILPGFIGKEVADRLRGLEIAKTVGAGLTFTEPPEFKREFEGKSFGEAVSARTAQERAAEKKSAAAKALETGKEKATGLFGDLVETVKGGASAAINGIENSGLLGTLNGLSGAFYKALEQNISGGQTQTKIGAVPSTVGSEMSALLSNTKDLENNSELAAAMIPSMSGGSGKKTTNVSAQSVTYNSNNIPDRTSWMTTPLANWSL